MSPEEPVTATVIQYPDGRITTKEPFLDFPETPLRASDVYLQRWEVIRKARGQHVDAIAISPEIACDEAVEQWLQEHTMPADMTLAELRHLHGDEEFSVWSPPPTPEQVVIATAIRAYRSEHPRPHPWEALEVLIAYWQQRWAFNADAGTPDDVSHALTLANDDHAARHYIWWHEHLLLHCERLYTPNADVTVPLWVRYYLHAYDAEVISVLPWPEEQIAQLLKDLPGYIEMTRPHADRVKSQETQG